MESFCDNTTDCYDGSDEFLGCGIEFWQNTLILNLLNYQLSNRKYLQKFWMSPVYFGHWFR